MTAVADRRQIFCLERVTAEQRDRGGPQALHGKGKIGEAIVPGENLARGADRAHVEFLAEPAIGRRHDSFQPTGVSQGLDKSAAGSIDIAVIDIPCDFLVSPGGQRRTEAAVLVAKKRPGKVSERRHQRPPACWSSPLSRNMNRWIFPVAVFGRLSTNSIQ